jgi:hypothetical protein
MRNLAKLLSICGRVEMGEDLMPTSFDSLLSGIGEAVTKAEELIARVKDPIPFTRDEASEFLAWNDSLDAVFVTVEWFAYHRPSLHSIINHEQGELAVHLMTLNELCPPRKAEFVQSIEFFKALDKLKGLSKMRQIPITQWCIRGRRELPIRQWWLR